MIANETATLQIHICDQRRSYKATFSTEAQALAFLAPRSTTHAWEEIRHLHGQDAGSVPATWTKLLDFLYPTCEHGLSLDLCAGPDHYMSAAQEQAMGWDYSDAPSGF